MTTDMLIVFALLGATVALFLSDRVRLDLVAMLVIVALPLTGVIPVAEAVAGFGAPVVLLIAALFVVGEGLFRTGVASAVGAWVLRVGGHGEVRLLLILMPVVALLSAFMSSTGAVALFIPVVLSLARNAAISPSRLLMPLAFSALIGGMLTLIGTPPNMVVSGRMEAAGFQPFGFFDFTPVGLVILVAGIAYLALFGRFLLPQGAPEVGPRHPLMGELAARYGLEGHLSLLKVRPGSPLDGRDVVAAGLRTHHGVTVIGLRRRGRLMTGTVPVLAETVLRAGDDLFVAADPEATARLCGQCELDDLGLTPGQMHAMRREFGLAEVIVTPESPLIGGTIKDARFRQRHGLSVIGVRRQGEPVETVFSDSPMAFGDTLIMAGSWNRLARLGAYNREFVVLDTPAEMAEAPSRSSKAPLALVISGIMLVLMAGGAVPALSAVLMAALAMLMTGCVTLEEAYKSMSWSSLVLIAGMLPLAGALEATGGVAFIVGHLVSALGGYGPMALCAGLFLLTALFSQFISNTATTVLVAPIALSAAGLLGLAPEPFMMTVALAASTAFATPMASPVNTLVLTPGGYRFRDFLKVGVPLQLVAMALTLILVPLLFRFSP